MPKHPWLPNAAGRNGSRGYKLKTPTAAQATNRELAQTLGNPSATFRNANPITVEG
jgi:hypothetical protein